MTVESDIKKAIANSEALRGSYILMAESTEDQQAKGQFGSMAS